MRAGNAEHCVCVGGGGCISFPLPGRGLGGPSSCQESLPGGRAARVCSQVTAGEAELLPWAGAEAAGRSGLSQTQPARARSPAWRVPSNLPPPAWPLSPPGRGSGCRLWPSALQGDSGLSQGRGRPATLGLWPVAPSRRSLPAPLAQSGRWCPATSPALLLVTLTASSVVWGFTVRPAPRMLTSDRRGLLSFLSHGCVPTA